MSRLRPPPFLAGALEGLTPFEVARLAAALPRLSRAPRGEGRPVLVFPGYGADDASTLPLRGYLRAIGHDARGWGLGSNVGDVPAMFERATIAVRELVAQLAEPVSLVGWSLGGYIAREVAREAPEAVRRVVTLGSPIAGGPKYTQLAPLYRLRGEDVDAIEEEIRARENTPLRVPVTALYSKFDGIVAWQACVDGVEAVTENVEVRTTHLGFGVSPEVFGIVADRLARPVRSAA